MCKLVFLYITNGPRTGKFDSKTGQAIEAAHRKFADKPYVVDKVTADLIARLQEKGFKEGVDFKLFNFKFLLKGGVESALSELYHHASTTDSILYIPAESISNVSAVIALGMQGKMKIYDTTSMNPNHERFVANVQNKLSENMVIEDSVEQVAQVLFFQYQANGKSIDLKSSAVVGAIVPPLSSINATPAVAASTFISAATAASTATTVTGAAAAAKAVIANANDKAPATAVEK